MTDQKEQTIKSDRKDKETPKRGRNRELFRIYRRITVYIAIFALIQMTAQSVVYHLLKGRLSEEAGGLSTLLLSVVNMLVVAALMAVSGYFVYRKLQIVGKSIDALASGKTVHLPEEGIEARIAQSINKTSDRLKEQQELIEKRDNMRMEWIRGVSHDIRTPLSMVMGYSEALEEDESLSEEQRRSAHIIKEQSMRMRELIEDLNLTSKLEYNKQPLRLAAVRPAELLREVVAGAINAQFLEDENTEQQEADGTALKNEEGGAILEKYDISLIVLPEFETLSIEADRNLLRRVFDNIIGNAIRHNPSGCRIMILAHKVKEHAVIEVMDDGVGIPEEVACMVNSYGSSFRLMEQEMEAVKKQEGEERIGIAHVMGMRIAKQIMLAHGGNLIVKPDRHTVEIVL